MAYYFAYSDQVLFLWTWEWLPQYALRSTLYPAYLSMPLHLLRATSLDSNVMVRTAPIFMNCLIQTAGDIYTVRLASLISTSTAHLAIQYSLMNKIINLIFQKTMTNGAEAVLCLAGLFYYSKLNISKSLNYSSDLVKMTACITVAFLVRSSSIIGWVPLALWTVVKTKEPLNSLITIITVAFTTAVPLFALSIGIDSYFYGKLTCPQYNFVYFNVV